MSYTFTLPKRLDRFAAVQADGRRERQARAAATKEARHAEQRLNSRGSPFLIRLFLGRVPLSTHELRLPDEEAARVWATGALSPYGAHLEPRALINGELFTPATRIGE